MILGFKKKFPDNTPTHFKEKILSGEKIHSLRKSDRFREGMSIQMAYGVRTKYYEQFNKGIENLSTCISVQEVFMTINRSGVIEVTIDDDNYLTALQIDKLIINDGLTREPFIEWFFPLGRWTWSGYIIHWTNFKY